MKRVKKTLKSLNHSSVKKNQIINELIYEEQKKNKSLNKLENKETVGRTSRKRNFYNRSDIIKNKIQQKKSGARAITTFDYKR